MNLKCLLFFVLSMAVITAVTTVSCGRAKQTDVAALTAKGYYDYLIQGKYDDFVAGLYHEDDMSEEYRRQLVADVKMNCQLMKRRREGLASVEVDHAVWDEKNRLAEVFLQFHYADSSIERVLVPMMQVGEIWYMR